MSSKGRAWALLRSVAIAIAIFALLIGLQLARGQVGILHSSLLEAGARLAVACVGVALLVGCYRGLVGSFEHRTASELSSRRIVRRLGGGALIGAGLYLAVTGLLLLSGNACCIAYHGFSSLVPALSAAAIAAVGEEIVFRAALYRTIERLFGTATALILTALVFGAMHLLNAGATIAVVIGIALESGLLLGLAFSLTETIWLGVGIHFGWNFTEGGLLSTSTSPSTDGLFGALLSGRTSLTGGDAGLEASLPAMGACLCASLIFLTILLRKRRPQGGRRAGAGLAG